ncbi:MAG: thioredoxin domain-containing protein [Sandaracinaceae bacterium]|nr:thioredoxin domain-containing protein [Sandaracinaceae bacterium]
MARWLALALLLASCGGAAPVAATLDEPPAVDGPWAERPDLARVHVPLDDSPGRGAAEPLVTLVVFTDFECPYCQQMAEVFDELLAAHPDALRVHHRHLPLPMHERAMDAAMAVEEARAQRGVDGFWAMHDAILESPDALHDRGLSRLAAGLGLDAGAVRDAIRFQRHAARVEDDLGVADRAGVRGTPTYFLNGRMILGALSLAELGAVFEEEASLARQAMARGVPRRLLYAAAMRESLERAPSREALERERARIRLDRRVLYAVPIDGRPQRGAADAPVTIVMFSDFECPWCGSVVPTLEALDARYPDQLRYVFRHNPLPGHARARPAARAAMEAYAQQGDEGFWRMHDVLVENRRALGRHDLAVYAEELGLDLARFEAAVAGTEHDAAIDADIALARRLGARSTPTFYVSGRVIEGAVDEDVFAVAIDDALERAAAAREAGASAPDLYEVLLREAATEAVYRRDP